MADMKVSHKLARVGTRVSPAGAWLILFTQPENYQAGSAAMASSEVGGERRMLRGEQKLCECMFVRG
eukprot:44229-Eustigmatos_ZCMA.PRE.1